MCIKPGIPGWLLDMDSEMETFVQRVTGEGPWEQPLLEGVGEAGSGRRGL